MQFRGLVSGVTISRLMIISCSPTGCIVFRVHQGWVEPSLKSRHLASIYELIASRRAITLHRRSCKVLSEAIALVQNNKSRLTH